MGKVLGIFGTKISGKVGSVVFRNNGKVNVISEKPANVKNPRTYSQQLQRMCMSTAGAAYKSMKEICDHSYEGITYGAASMSYFMKENIKALSLAKYTSGVANFNAMGNNYGLPNTYLVSKGSLPSLTALTSVEVSGTSSVILHTADISLEVETATVQDFCDAFGIDLGDQLTVCLLYTTKADAADNQKQSNFIYSRLIFKTDAAGTTVFDGRGGFNEEALDTDKSENWDALTVDLATYDGISFSLMGLVDSNTLAAGCFIRSKKVGNSWQRSTQNMMMTDVGANYEASTVVNSYSPSGEKYLNNAEQ